MYTPLVTARTLAALLLALPALTLAKAAPPPAPGRLVFPEHLQPCKYPFSKYAPVANSIIDQGSPGNYLAALTALPSFSSEWGIRVGTINETFYLRFVALKEPGWKIYSRQVNRSGDGTFDPSKAHASASVYQVPISEGLAESLHSVLGEEVSHTGPTHIFGKDGVTFFFSYGGESCAQSWTPPRSTRPGKLVDIFMDLKKLATEKSVAVRAKLENEILTKLENFSPKN